MTFFIHREGYSTLRKLGIGLLGICLGTLLFLPRRAFMPIVALSAVALGFVAQFFRNPRRITPDRDHAIIAPADGTIVAVERVPENEYFRDERLKISIYMSALNVHLNRVPLTGEVVYNQYHPGEYLVAFHPKASELNERNTVVLRRKDDAEVLVRQIAGLIARRIRFYLQNGQAVRAGDELGFIKFGSRCDVFLPLNAQVCVDLQQKVKGGETILAEIK